jgi:hypothetical protein
MDPFHPACRDATVTSSGVYKIDAKTRKVTPLATKAEGWPFCYPDDVAVGFGVEEAEICGAKNIPF